MHRTAGVALPRSRPILLATLALLGFGVLGFASSVALAGEASPFEVTTGDTTTTNTATAQAPTTSATTTAPDPPPPLPKPDPRPRKRPRVAPPPPPAPEPAAPQPTTAAPAVAAPPPPPPSASVKRRTTTTATRTRRRSRQRSTPRVPRSQRITPRVSKAPRDRRSLSPGGAERALERTAAPPPGVPEAESPLSGGMVAVSALFALGLLSLVAAAVPPARVPWPLIADSMSLHRSDVTMIGLGAIVIALVQIAILL